MNRIPHFFIATPIFNEGSDGVKMLHFLCHSLNKIGVHSSIVFMDPRDPSNNSFITAIGDQGINKDLITPVVKFINEIDLENDVIIYPEIVQGNPLKGKNIARYFLNKNAFITGDPISIGENDFILTYQKIFNLVSHFNLYYPMQDIGQIPSREALEKSERPFSLTYIGKGLKYGNCARISNTIGLDWKKSKEEYFLLLEHSQFLFTWDPMTGVVFDAIIRGCIPIYLLYKPWTEKEVFSQELLFPRMTAIDFDNKTEYFSDYKFFLDERERMITQVINFQNNWDTQVECFVEKVIKHFY